MNIYIIELYKAINIWLAPYILISKYPEKADIIILNRGDKFHVAIGLKHRMFAIEDTELFEFSTEHSDSDSHRIMPGDLI